MITESLATLTNKCTAIQNVVTFIWMTMPCVNMFP